jgi:hypothetical protein
MEVLILRVQPWLKANTGAQARSRFKGRALDYRDPNLMATSSRDSSDPILPMSIFIPGKQPK